MACIDILSDSTGKEIVAAIQSTDVAQARISEINAAAELKKNEVLESIPEDYNNIVNDVNQLKGDLVELEGLLKITNFIDLTKHESLPTNFSVTRTTLNSGTAISSVRTMYVPITGLVKGNVYKVYSEFSVDTQYDTTANVRLYKQDKSTEIIRILVSGQEYEYTSDGEDIYLRVQAPIMCSISISSIYIKHKEDMIGSLKDESNKANNSAMNIFGILETFDDTKLYSGIVSRDSGDYIQSTNSARISLLKSKTPCGKHFELPNDYRFLVYYYDSNGLYNHEYGWIYRIDFENYPYCALVFKRNDESPITESDISIIKESFVNFNSFNEIDKLKNFKLFKYDGTNSSETNAQNAMSSVIKALYIPDVTNKDNMRLCAMRIISNSNIWQIRIYDLTSGTAIAYQYNSEVKPKKDIEYVIFEGYESNGEKKAYALIDWAGVQDGTSITGKTGEVFTLSDECFKIDNCSPLWSFIANYDDKKSENVYGEYDVIETGEMNSNIILLHRNESVPINDYSVMCMSTDIDNYTEFSSINEPEMLKSMIPYLYFNGKKVGTVIMYDDNGAYFYNKNGVKMRISATEEV